MFRIFVILCITTTAHAKITARMLLGEMASLDHLARRQNYKTLQASSYDRASKAPGEAGWFANQDKGQFVRVEESGERVMVDASGPGALVRIWSANPQGTLRIYLDGATEPVIEAPMEDLLAGRVPPFAAPLAHEAAKGFNFYFPIPFARRLVVTCDRGDERGKELYYHVNWRRYPDGTAVQSFTPREPLGDEIARVAKRLQAGGDLDGPRRAIQFLPGKPVVLAAPPGGGVLKLFSVQAPKGSFAAMRKIVLAIKFDGEETVRAPLTDFFGAGPWLTGYKSLPFVVEPNGFLTALWPMPFARRAEISLEGATLDATVRVEPRRFDGESLLFHARFHGAEDFPTTAPLDWNLVTVEGRGHYVGNALHVRYFAHSWWGEGDEKIFVDGERFPSWFGTGTEDYYGYAWCSSRKFAHAYHAQTRADGPDTTVGRTDGFGYTVVNRWHVLDPIPFDKSFRFDFELLDWLHNSHITVEAMAYFYARPGAKNHLKPITEKDLNIP